jgi:hypothetical protein
MNIVGDRKDLLRFARRARARLGLVRAVETFFRALFWAVCAAFAAVLAVRLFGLPLLVAPAGAVLGGAVLVAALGSLIFPRLSLVQAAAAVDRHAGWKERLSSALALPAPQHPMELALVDDVRGRLRTQSPSDLFPLRAPRELRWTPLAALALAAVSYWLPPVDLFGLAARADEQRKQTESVRMAVEKLEQRKKTLEKDGRALERMKEAGKRMDELQAELSKTPPPSPQEALAQIAKTADELKKLKDELSRSAGLADKLRKAASERPDSDAGELGKLLKEGKFAEAAQELAKMRNALQEGKMTPAEREKLRKQMDALAEKLSKDKALSELERKLAQAMKGLEQGDEKALDGLQQDLSQLDADQAEGEGLGQALKDLERLADALAKGRHECPD